MFKSITKFMIVFFVMTVLNTKVWEYVAGDLYDCTDDCIPGYLQPGSWAHSWEGHPVAVVPQILHGRSMSETDSMKAGWNVASLLCLWFLFFSVSLLVSIFLARVRWIPATRPKL
jgi:hypothetical protein